MGDGKAMSASARQRFELFTGKAGCADCHQGFNFTEDRFRNIGIYKTLDLTLIHI